MNDVTRDVNAALPCSARAGAAVAAAQARRAEDMRKRSGRTAGSSRTGRQSARSQSSVVRFLCHRVQINASQLLNTAIQLTGILRSCGGLRTLNCARHHCTLVQAAPSAVRAPVGLLERRRRANPREQHTGDSDIEDDRAYD